MNLPLQSGEPFPRALTPPNWHEGIKIYFDVAQQVRAVFHSLTIYYQLFLLQGGLFVGWLTLLLGGQRGWKTLNSVLHQWPLFMPAFTALGMLLIMGHLEFRHCAPWLVLMWMGFFGGCPLPRTEDHRQRAKRIIVAMVIFLAILVSHSTAREFAKGLRPVIDSHQPAHLQWEVAKGLKQMGIRTGEQVAHLRNSNRADWARLARVKIISEIPPSDIMQFWTAGERIQAEIIETLFSTGARAIVAETPLDVPVEGWKRIGQTEYYVWILKR